MKRSTWDGAMTVYRYGTTTGWDLPPEAIEQLRLGHELRNKLVELENTYTEAVAAVWAAHPVLAEANDAVDAADATVAGITERAKAQRIEDRSTVTRPDTKTELTEARKVLREAKAARRAAKDVHYAEVRDGLRAVLADRNAARKGCYADFVQTRGLFWATYNDVLAGHESAVKRVAQLRKEGRPAAVRFQRWTGEGTLCVQLQRQATDPPRTPILLASGEGPWKNVAQLEPWVHPDEWETLTRSQQRQMTRLPDDVWAAMTRDERRNQGHGSLTVTIGNKRSLRVPAIVHRMLPPEADVTLVRVTRRFVADRPVVTATVTARIPAPTPVTSGPVAALHIGWRSIGDDGTRVAMIAATGGVPAVPDRLAHIARVTGEGTIEVRVPAELRAVAGRPSAIRSRRDLMLDDLRGEIILALPKVGAPDLPTGAEVARWRSPARFVTLTRQWPDDDPLKGRLNAWLRQDRHLWTWEANERAQTAGHIRELWRLIAAWLGSWAGMIVIDDMPVRELTLVPGVGTEDTVQARAARAARQVCSPGGLRAAVVSAADARGIPVEITPADHVSIVHHPCGTQNDGGDTTRLWCPTCSAHYDRDVNAAHWLLTSTGAVRDLQPGLEVSRA